MLTGSWDYTTRLWDAATGAELASFAHFRSVMSVAYAPDGRAVLTGSQNGLAYRWPLDREFWPILPYTPTPRPNTLAIIIGNQNYTAGPPQVPFAQNDARAFERFFIDVMGLDQNNVWTRPNLGLVGFQSLFGDARRPLGQIHRFEEFYDELFVVYIGHGAPDINDGDASPVLLPTDSTGLRGTYAMNDLYESLARLDVENVTLVLDACFSGQTNAGPVLPHTMGFSVVSSPRPPRNIAVLTATDTETLQYAHWLEDVGHSAFSYHLLQGLYGAADEVGNQDGSVTLAEAHAYSRRAVALDILQRFGREQFPAISPDITDTTLISFKTDDARPVFPPIQTVPE